MGRANHSATPVAKHKKTGGGVLHLSCVQILKLITKKGIATRKDHIQIKTTRNQFFQMTIKMVNISR